jgi:signal transduction histidine kinase
VGLLGLIVGLAAVTNAFTQRSTKSDETALAARSDLVYAERAVTRYWRERVALNEHLLSPSAPLRSEMTPYELAFERALGRVGATTPREHVLVASALVADHAMISAFARYESDVGAGATLRGAYYQASLVVHGLAKLAALHETEADSATVQAASARALARNFRILTLLLIAAAIVVSAAWAIRLFRRIADQNRELKALDALKDEFVASVSHELRTPLTSIRGYLALLREQGAEEVSAAERDSYMAVVDRNADRLLHLVEDLLFIARLDAASLQLEQEPLSLTRLVEEAVDAALPAASLKELTLTLSACEVSEFVGDAARLGQLLDNLISNAIKFTQHGQVAVTLQVDAGQAVIEVADSGLGIPAGEQKRLFERFYRTSAANLNAVQGSGLGLSIAKAIAEGHGGTLEFESVEHHGTTFRLRLPLTRAPRPQTAALAESPTPGGRPWSEVD